MSYDWSFSICRIGSDEEDNDSDQEESNEDELETAVSRQGSVVQANEFNSNGHDYVIVNRLTDSKRIGDQQSPEDPWEDSSISFHRSDRW